MAPQPASTTVDGSSILLRVSSLERATRFCRDVLGFRLVVYGPDVGLQAAFLSAGVRQQFLLTTCDSPGHPRSEVAGDPHVSICYPTAWSFSRAVRRALLSDCEIVTSWVRTGGVAVVGLRQPNGTIARLSCDQPLAGTLEPEAEEWLRDDVEDRPAAPTLVAYNECSLAGSPGDDPCRTAGPVR